MPIHCPIATIVDERWDSRATGADSFRARLMSLIEDWGAGLGIGLYEEAVTHFLGGEDRVLLPVPVIGGKRHIANQRMRMAVSFPGLAPCPAGVNDLSVGGAVGIAPAFKSAVASASSALLKFA